MRADRGWRVGLLGGTGTGRKRILPALRESTVCHVRVVHGRDPDRLAATVRSDPTVQVVSSEEEFAELADEMDVVYIGSPPFLRTRHVALAAGMGKPILCEKPLAITQADAEEIGRTVRDAGVFFRLAHQVRQQPALEDVRAAVSGAAWGPVRSAHLQWTFWMDRTAPNAVWKVQPELAGSSSMFDSGVHVVDVAVLLFGLPYSVFAVGHADVAAVAETVTATLDYGEYAVTVVTSQRAAPSANDLRISFAQAGLSVAGFFGERAAPRLCIDAGGQSHRRDYTEVNLYRKMVEDLCAAAFAGRDGPGTSLADAEAVVRVLFALEESRLRRRPVPLR